ncbi:MAG: hypothetical protein DLM61_04450, partial [Pseudonocardiales bacterium]
MLFLGFALAVAVVALSHEHERAFSAAVFYVGLGALAAGGLVLLGVKPFDPVRDHRLLERLAELALVVAVFSSGISVERNVRRRSWVSIVVLLAVVMPLTIAAVAAIGAWGMGLSLGAALLLGAVVAPTDPVLAGDVGLGPPGSEEQGEPRLSLHTEAGINDGLASPFVLLGVFVAARGGTGWLGEWVLADVIYGVGVAALLGVLAGSLAAAGLARARDRDLFSRDLDGFTAIALVLAVYGATEVLGAYGLLAVFAAMWGLLVAVRILRGEDESGGMELVLSGVVSRRAAFLAAVAVIWLGAAVLWAATCAGLVVGGLALGGSLYLALAVVAAAPVFAGVGALASQLVPTARQATLLGSAALLLALVLRVVADTVAHLAWLRWATPLGWIEELRPFAGPRPAVLILPVLAAA